MEIGKLKIGKFQIGIALLTILISFLFLVHVSENYEFQKEIKYEPLNNDVVIIEDYQYKYIWDNHSYSTSSDDVSLGNARMATKIYIDNVENFLINNEEAVEFRGFYFIPDIAGYKLKIIHGAVIDDQVYYTYEKIINDDGWYVLIDYKEVDGGIVLYYKMYLLMVSLVLLLILSLGGSVIWYSSKKKVKK